MTQVNTIRKQLLSGNTLTQRSALLDFGIMALPRRIADLKESGFPIESVMKSNPLTGQRYAEYSMSKKVTSLTGLIPDCVYRVKNVRINIFNDRLFEQSKGYFVVERTPHPRAQSAVVTMAGLTQIIMEHNLTGSRPHFEIEYVGGMN